MPKTRLRRARVRVPCSTSNLGAGFDCLGLALNRYIDVEYQPGTSSLTVERAGTARWIVAERDHTLQSFLDQLTTLGTTGPTGVLRVQSDIPVGRGLGSSAAATVAGLLLARAAAGEQDPDRQVLLDTATRREGHPDNAAPALLGGLVAVARAVDEQPRAFKLPLSPQVGFAFAAPDVEVPTPMARRALPQSVSHPVATRALGRVAAVIQGLATADPELLRIGFADELHVPYRLPFIPQAKQAIQAGLDAGAWAVTISGSGSGLIAVCAVERAADVAAAMRGAWRQTNTEATAFAAEPDLHGGKIEIEA
jgi:homoserine kinase